MFLCLYVYKILQFLYCRKFSWFRPQLTQQSSEDFLLVSLSRKLLKSFYFIKFVPKLINHKRRAESVRFWSHNSTATNKEHIYIFIFLSPSNVSMHRITVQNNILGRVTHDSVLLGKVTTCQQLPMPAYARLRSLKQTDTNKSQIGISA